MSELPRFALQAPRKCPRSDPQVPPIRPSNARIWNPHKGTKVFFRGGLHAQAIGRFGGRRAGLFGLCIAVGARRRVGSASLWRSRKKANAVDGWRKAGCGHGKHPVVTAAPNADSNADAARVWRLPLIRRRSCANGHSERGLGPSANDAYISTRAGITAAGFIAAVGDVLPLRKIGRLRHNLGHAKNERPEWEGRWITGLSGSAKARRLVVE